MGIYSIALELNTSEANIARNPNQDIAKKDKKVACAQIPLIILLS